MTREDFKLDTELSVLADEQYLGISKTHWKEYIARTKRANKKIGIDGRPRYRGTTALPNPTLRDLLNLKKINFGYRVDRLGDSYREFIHFWLLSFRNDFDKHGLYLSDDTPEDREKAKKEIDGKNWELKKTGRRRKSTAIKSRKRKQDTAARLYMRNFCN